MVGYYNGWRTQIATVMMINNGIPCTVLLHVKRTSYVSCLPLPPHICTYTYTYVCQYLTYITAVCVGYKGVLTTILCHYSEHLRQENMNNPCC